MTAYIIRRLLLAVLTLLIVTLLIFFAMRLLPGDPALMYLTQHESMITQEQIDEIREQYGLNRPLMTQYFDWVGNALKGDLGLSLTSGLPVMKEIKLRLPVSLYLGSIAMILSSIIGISAGVIAALRRGGWLDNVLTSFGNLGMTVPNFWLGVLLIYFFALRLRWLPVFGYTSPFDNLGLSLKQLIMPIFCLCVPAIAGDIRVVRSSMLEVMRQDYIRTAWSKGLRERTVVVRHALKNGFIPIITIKGMHVATIFGGQVLMESVFAIPGMGKLAVTAVQLNDYLVMQGVILIVATVILITNLLVDLSYGWIDPRIRYD